MSRQHGPVSPEGLRCSRCYSHTHRESGGSQYSLMGTGREGSGWCLELLQIAQNALNVQPSGSLGIGQARPGCCTGEFEESHLRRHDAGFFPSWFFMVGECIKQKKARRVV